MSFSEYDRNLLQEFRNTLYEIRDIIAENLELNRKALNYAVQKNNKNADLALRLLRCHVDLHEEANEEE